MASKRSGLLRVMSHQQPRTVTIRLFKSYVRPTMEYASAVWHSSLKEEDASSIERIQAGHGVARCLLKAELSLANDFLQRTLMFQIEFLRRFGVYTFFRE